MAQLVMAAALRPPGSSFWISTKAASPKTQVKLITPPTNSSSISAQQQPRQYPPCRAPMRSAPPNPGRQWALTKATGPRQWRRQACFSGVSS